MTLYNVPVLRDFSWQAPVKDKDLTTPPGSESKGDRYIVKADGGDWSGHTTHVAMAKQDNPSEAGHWIFATPVEGWITWIDDEDQYYYFDGTSWVPKIDPPAVNAALSSMILTGGEVTSGTNAGTIKVAALTAYLRTGTGASDPLVKISLVEVDNITLTDADVWYHLILTYGATVTSSTSVGNGANIIKIGHCLKEDDDTMHYSTAGLRLADGVRKLHRRASELRTIEISSGGLVSDPGTRNLHVTAGIFYRGINKYETSAISTLDSGVWFDYFYWNPDGSTWVKDDNEGAHYTQIDNVQYNKVDSGTGLANLAVNRYTTNWIFLHPDEEHILVLYGRSYNKLTSAENEEIPASLPDILDEMAVLLCKVIVQQGSDDLIFENVKYFTFTPQVVVDHNELSGLQGGQADEYHHLNTAEEADVGLNTTHRGSDGSDHSKIGDNETAIGLNTTHRGEVSGNPHIVTPTELGLIIGSDVQAHGAVLDDLNTLGAVGADSEFLVGTGIGALTWENAATARTSLGVGTGDSPTFANVGLGTGELTCGSINRASGVMSLEIGGTSVVSLSDANMYPTNDGGSSLGGINNRWDHCYIKSSMGIGITYEALGILEIGGGRLVFSDGGGAARWAMNMESNTAATGYAAINVYDYDASAAGDLSINESGGKVCIGTATRAGQLRVYQGGAGDAEPVLQLDQLDIDDVFINFVGTSAVDGTRSISSDATEEGAKAGAFRIEINNVVKWVRFYDNES